MQNVDFEKCYAEVLAQFSENAIRTYIVEELRDMQFESPKQIARQLETASCAYGSYSGVIYNSDIDEKLSRKEWRDAISEALEDFADCTGEEFSFTDFTQALWFAIEWEARRLAMWFEDLELCAIVTLAVDTCDPNPELIAFPTTWEAEEFAAEEIARRVQFQVEHAQYSVSEAEIDAMREAEAQLVMIERT